jgi:hypothetical protein
LGSDGVRSGPGGRGEAVAAVPDMAGSRVHGGVDSLADHVLWTLGPVLVVRALGVVELLVPRLPGVAGAVSVREGVCHDLSGERGRVCAGPRLGRMEAHVEIVPPNILNIGVRGAALGLVYACLHFYQKKQVLSFPIIQVKPPSSPISRIALLSVPGPSVIQ